MQMVFSYQISDHLTPKSHAEQRRFRQLIQQNKKLDADKHDVKLENQQLMIDGVKNQKGICPPSCREILIASKELRMNRADVDLAKGNVVKVESQLFIGYTICAKSLEEVNLAYAKVRSLLTDARHVICSC